MTVNSRYYFFPIKCRLFVFAFHTFLFGLCISNISVDKVGTAIFYWFWTNYIWFYVSRVMSYKTIGPDRFSFFYINLIKKNFFVLFQTIWRARRFPWGKNIFFYFKRKLRIFLAWVFTKKFHPLWLAMRNTKFYIT